ncbi:hypothetical protein COO60DRAFT_1640967 [Scenedesmus sp. NREL 46B-D3]|nr:hypothetical protein COO60DRAFT_1640967 [Scenedesmus sp. NREL 46B-D3]
MAALSYQLPAPKFFISDVKATVVSTYAWQITRQSTASGVTLTANGQERQQMGYTLTYTKVLQKRDFVIEGSADVTNLSGADKLTLMSLTVFVGAAATSPSCRGMPQSPYTMQPVETLRCPFKLVATASPGAAQLTGFVQTVRGRVEAVPVPFSFEACSGGSGSSSGITSFSSLGSTAAAPAGTAVTCTMQNVGDCVDVTDGSYVQNKYQDAAGTAAAGEIPRSQLFAVGSNPSTPWGSSTQGPPRTEPVLPADAAAAADVAASSSGRASIADLPDASWYGHRRRQHRRRRKLLAVSSAADTGLSPAATAAAAAAGPPRALQQLPFSGSGDAGSQRGNQFKWPIPQVVGVRPPVGTNGKPSTAVPPKTICATQPFQFSMIFGPLLPEACGIFEGDGYASVEVHNTAAAAYTDNSQPPVTHTTYFYLTVYCPVADPAAAAAAANGNLRFSSVEDVNPAVEGLPLLESTQRLRRLPRQAQRS